MSCFLIHAQCPRLLDGNGNFSANPVWVHCNGTGYTLYIQTNQATGAYTINWGDGSPVTSGASLTPPATVSHTYPATLRNYTITFTEPGKNCTITGLLVLERPVNAAINRPLGSGGVTTICAPGDLGFINSSTDVSVNTTFRWDFGDGSPILTKNYTDSGKTNTHTYQRNTVNCNTTVRLEAENYCTVTPSFATVGPINIYDLDDAAITASANFLCYPDTEITVINSSNLNCRPQGNTTQRYEYWNFGKHWGNPTDSVKGWIPFANPPSVAQPLAFPGKGTYTVTLYDSNMCGIDTTTTTIVVGDPPNAAFTTDKDTICAGNRIRFFNNSTGGANQSRWNFGDGVWRTRGMGNQNRTFNTPGAYTILLAVNNTNGTASCTDTASYDIYVLPGPTADFSINPASGCDSINVAITENSGSAAQWNWNFGDGTFDTVANPSVHVYDSIGNYTIGLLVTHSNGCTDSTSRAVTVYGSPVVDFTPKNVCQGVVASFTDNSTSPGGDPLTSWNWNFGDGGTSTQQNPTHKYDSSKTYTISLTVTTANCTSTDTFNVIVEPKPTAAFTMNDSIGCSPLTVVFTNNSAVSTQYNWDFGDGDTSTQTTPTHSFINSTSSTVGYRIRLIASTAFGCSDTAYDSVYVYDVPQSSFTSDAVPQCGPNTVNFTNTSTGGISNLWLFGDGDTSTQNNPSHTYQNKTLFIQNYVAQLVVTSSNGCTDTSRQTIVIYPEPIFTFQALPDSGCSPLNVSFPAVTGAVAYKWYFGDGDSATGSSPKHKYFNNTTNNRTYTVTLIATSSFGCSDTNTGTILVFPNPKADFTVTDSIACQPHNFTVNNLSTGAVKYHWNFGNGDTSDTAASLFPYVYTHNNTTPTNYRLQLVAETQDGCFDTVHKTMTTYPQIHARFNTNLDSGCTPLAVNFNNFSSGAQFNAWQFGDGSSSITASPSYTYRNTRLTDTLFYPKLVVTSQYNCQDSLTDTIKVHPLPVASFSKNFTAGCHPLPVVFTNNSSIADTSSWSFGDGSLLNSNASSVTHTYTNTGTTSITRTITLVVETNRGCKDTTTQSIDIYPEIVADFIKSDTAGCTPLTVRFTDRSRGSQFFNWNFGDGNSSSNANPSHTFLNSGLNDTTFIISQIVRSTFGCEDTLRDSVLVYPKPISSFQPSSIRGCQPLPVTFTNNSVLNANNYWDFADGDTSNFNGNPTHSFSHNVNIPQNFNVRLIVETAQGCRDTSYNSVEVYPPIVADFSRQDTAGCSEFTLQFTNQSTGENQYLWDFDNGKTDRISDPVHTFENADTLDKIFDISLKVTSVYGCSDSIAKRITVYPQPVAAFVATPVNQKYPNATVNLTNTGNRGPWSFDWEYGDGSSSKVRDPGNHTFPTWGKFNIQLIAFTPNCADTAIQEITIEPPAAVVNFNASKKGCRPLVLNIENNTIYGKQFLWNFGDGGTSNLENPAPYVYYNPGTYTISLTVIGEDNGVINEFKVDSVTVYDNAIALFDYRPKKVSVPNQAVLFYNISQSSDRWTWDFGDGNTSNEQNPEYYYEQEGIYTISLIASNEFGCADTYQLENAVEAISVGNLTYPTAFTPNAGGSSGGYYDPLSIDNDIFFPIQEGVVEYELMVFNRWGEMVFTTKDVKQGWDGYYRGTEKLCPQDVYVWKATGLYANGKRFEMAGEVTLLR
jgi:gliding motility-associated-like protein